jgi:tRNA1Val (adenine37-N6)-methyltransferase
VGSGVGVVSLLLAAAAPVASIEGIEIQEVMYLYSKKNQDEHLRFLRAPVAFTLGDVRAWRERWAPGSFDRVVANPPFFKVSQGHPSPHPIRRVARQEVALTSDDLLEAAAGLLAPEGVGVFVYPIHRGFEVARQAEARGLHVHRRAVRSYVDDPPFLAIVEVAHRPFRPTGGRERPLTLYDGPHRYQDWLQKWVDLIRRPSRDDD